MGVGSHKKRLELLEAAGWVCQKCGFPAPRDRGAVNTPRLITVATERGHPHQVEAEAFGVLAVHPALGADGFTVTHLPSGWIVVRVATERDAQVAALKLASLPWGMVTDYRRIPQAFRAAFRDLWRALGIRRLETKYDTGGVKLA